MRRETEKKIAAYRQMVGKNRTYRRWVKAFPISSRSGTTAAWRRSKPMLPGIA